jgi:2-methylcitrate dehydratase PrpD
MRFFRPGTAGGFGAVAAAARILGLDAAAMASAFAWQLAQASGTMQTHREGSPILPVQVAFNARAALQSCELAVIGIAPAVDVFEGPFGYLALFEGDWDLSPVLDGLRKTWRIAEFSHKPYPAGRATHGGIEGVMTLRAQYGFTVADVASVRVSAPPLIVRLVGRPALLDAGASYARLCLGYVVAKVLLHGELDLAHFRGAALADMATWQLASRVNVIADDNPDPNAMAPQSVLMRLTDGREFHWRCDAMMAHPTRRLERHGQIGKFNRCLTFASEPLGQEAPALLAATIERLESLTDVRTLADLLAPSAANGAD